jgi:formate hydrogenlyase subunit 3/multisubunit Na+/H+ antiporter MnhD subunit
MNILFYSVAMPIVSSLFCFFSKRLSPWIALVISTAEIIMAVIIFFLGNTNSVLYFHSYVLNSGIFLAASVFSLLIVLYSLKFMEGNERLGEYYAYILITMGAAAGALFANDYFTLLSFWGILGATLYMLIGISGANAASAAKKTFIIVGGSDAVMIFGVGTVWLMTRSLQIGIFPIAMCGILPAIAFLSLLAGALAKAGAMPLHSWIPDCAEEAPIPVTAYLPASLDKLLGIYLLFRLCTDIFQVTPNSPASILLLVIGSFTIIAGVMAALVQHNMRKLLSFHAVSQVGYMVLGIGTALPIGMAGALFHMLNNTIYKSCLFLTSGSVEKEMGTGELDDLGGAAKLMPITFVSAAVAALSISGIPPFNGFFSKWMIYQGIIDLSGTSRLWVIWLCAAMFGSALTLASFVKLIHAVYLGQGSGKRSGSREAPWQMWLPPAILASLCAVFGVFAFSVPLPYFVLPSVKGIIYSGYWNPLLATVLIFAGLLIGLLVYWLGKERTTLTSPAYIGGEVIEEARVKVPGTGFYNTIRDYGPLDAIYRFAERKLFDIYDLGIKLVSMLYDFLGFLHNGLLHTYLAWMFLGFALIMLFIIF